MDPKGDCSNWKRDPAVLWTEAELCSNCVRREPGFPPADGRSPWECPNYLPPSPHDGGEAPGSK